MKIDDKALIKARETYQSVFDEIGNSTIALRCAIEVYEAAKDPVSPEDGAKAIHRKAMQESHGREEWDDCPQWYWMALAKACAEAWRLKWK